MYKIGDISIKTRKRVALTLRQKIDICQLLERGVSRNEIMKKYNVGSSTIYDIKAQKEHILKFMADSDSLSTLENRKNLRKPKLEQVDSLLYDWYKVMRADGLLITRKTLMEKAKEFHQHLNPQEQCNFSGGWLARFKIRHGIGKSDIPDVVKVREESDDEGFHLDQKLSDYEPELILEERSTADEKPEEFLRSISGNQPEALNVEPIVSEIVHDKAYQPFDLWRSYIPAQYSYPSHISKQNGSSATSSQPSYGDPTVSLILTETRSQTAEMRVAMGQLSDKIDNIMNKINQYQCQKWWPTTGVFQEDSEKRDEWLGEAKGHKITKMKLLAKIISIEEKCEILEKENISLKKDLDKATTKLLDFETDQLARISDSVKTALSSVYFDVENKFSNGVEYEGSDIRKVIASTIKEMTQELNGITGEENTELNYSKRMKLEKSPTLGKRKRKPKAKVKHNSREVSQKDSENNVTDLSRFIEICPESPKSDSEERWKHAFQKPSDILESTLILQDEVITLREESCSAITSKTGCKGKDVDPDPSPPQILAAGVLCESGEEWTPP